MKQVKQLQLGDEVALRSDVDPKLHQSAAAPVFDATQNYPAGYHVTYNGYLYRFTSAHAAGAWTGNDVTLDDMTTPDAMLDLTSAGFLRVVSADGTVLWMQNTLSASRSEIAADFSASAAYSPPALVVYNNTLYRCTTAHPAGAWNAAHFTLATVQDVLALMNTEIGGKQAALSEQQLANIAAVPDKADLSEIAYPFSVNVQYSVGEFVEYGGLFWRCEQSYTTTASSPTPDVDSAHWSYCPPCDGISSLDWTKADRASDPTAGNLAALDANGNPTDSTIPAANVALKGDIPYSLVTKTVSNNAVTLDDHACNYVDATSLAALDIEFPAYQEGKMRDFLFAVECGATPPNISYASYITIMAEDADMLVPEEGMNVYSFTEFKQNKFIAHRKTIVNAVVNVPQTGEQLLDAMRQKGISTTGVNTFGQAATALGLSGGSLTVEDLNDAVMG